MIFSLARQNFCQEIQKADPDIDLAKAALYIAQEEYSFLEPDVYIEYLDQVAEELKERLPETKYPLKVIKVINHYLYEELGFRGNKQNYYDPRNSFINDVIDRRLGIPITLSLVYLEIAKRLDFPMIGIGLPGHFIIRPNFEDVGIFVDPFNSGEILFEQDCQVLVERIYQQPIALEPRFLEPITHRQFLGRILTNLKFIFLNQHEFMKALGVIERILLVFPDNVTELRDRGLLYYQLNQWPQAIADLEQYLAQVPYAHDATMIQQLLMQMN